MRVGFLVAGSVFLIGAVCVGVGIAAATVAQHYGDGWGIACVLVLLAIGGGALGACFDRRG